MDSPRLTKKLLLIGWDAADWKILRPLLDAGRMPHLKKLLANGSAGNIATLQPCLSPILWTTIATGKAADKHGILGFVEPTPDASGLRLATSTSRTTKALWNILSQSGIRSSVVGWYASHPAEPVRGVCVSNRFVEDPPADARALWGMPESAVHPPEMADRIARARVHPASVLPSELAKYIHNFKQISPGADKRPALLARALAKAHSVHAAAAAILKSGDWDFLGVYYEAIDVIGHDFMPYYPPRLPHVSAEDFDRYRDVIAETYALHDQMLGRLIELAGKDATIIVVSDHGFHSDHLRPQSWDVGHTEETQAAAWHRPFGMVALHGPGVRAGQEIGGATLLDIAPTVLRLFGLPAGRDMDGRTLTEALDSASPIEPIATWDEVPGAEFMHGPDARQDPYVSMQAIQQLVDLGYMPPIAEDQAQAAATAHAEARFNLAAVHTHMRRPHVARPILEALHQEHPGQARYALGLARACFDSGAYADAEALLSALEGEGDTSSERIMLHAGTLLQLNRPDEAIARIRASESAGPPAAGVIYLHACALLAMREHGAALDALDRAIAHDPHSAPYHNVRAEALIALGRYEEACDSALTALELLPTLPQAHFHLGQALAAMGELDHAAQSLGLAVTHAPNYPEAHRLLADVCDRRSQPEQAERHRALARAAGSSPTQI